MTEKDFVIRDVKMLKPSGEVVTANIHVSGDKISKITGGEVTDGKIIDSKNKFGVGFVRYCEPI